MTIKIKTSFWGSWGAAVGALRWYQRKFPGVLDIATRDEAKFFSILFKKELRGGGNPTFTPLAPLTIAIRRAKGIAGSKPGLATRQVVNAIKNHKNAKAEYFAGVVYGSPHTSGDAGKMARLLELGRGRVVLELDKPGKSGKTPRQFFWWLYLQGAIQHAPSKTKTHIVLGASPPRPFVRQVVEREEKNIAPRLFARIHKEFLTVRLPSPVHGRSALKIPPWR